MTTNAEVLDLGMSRLGQRASTRVRADLLGEINAAINVAETAPFIPWFLGSTKAYAFSDFAISQNNGLAALPTDFIREQEDSRVFKTITGNSNRIFLTKRSVGMLEAKPQTSALVYAIYKSSLLVYAAPVSTEAYTLYYYKKQTGNIVDDATAISNEWLINAQNYILAIACGYVAKFHIQNDALAAKFELQERKEFKTLYDFHEARLHENQEYEVGGSSDGS